LLVDDDVDIRELAKRFLEAAGYTVATASDGEGGSVFTKSITQSIGLLLTDVAMPNISGLELGDRVLGIDSQLPILFMSAWCARLGLECIAKPFQRAELVASVSRALKVTTPLKVMTLGE
jgi:DNA-binding response OmpR family regulator